MMIKPRADGTEFNPYRAALWQALRKEYPVKIDPRALKGEIISNTEDTATYISRQLKRWKQETEKEAESSPLLTTLFGTSVIEAMPGPVNSRLDDVMGVTSKSHREFCDHVIHAVERHRKDEQRLKDQERHSKKSGTTTAGRADQ